MSSAPRPRHRRRLHLVCYLLGATCTHVAAHCLLVVTYPQVDEHTRFPVVMLGVGLSVAGTFVFLIPACKQLAAMLHLHTLARGNPFLLGHGREVAPLSQAAFVHQYPSAADSAALPHG